MTDRARLVAELLARAARKRVFGYCSDKAGCAEAVKGKVPDEWDRLCVEGDEVWTLLPPAGGAKAEGSEAA